MKLAPSYGLLDWGIIEPVPYVDPNAVDPIVYTQAFSPEFLDVTSIANDGFQKTVNASVRQKDELAGQYSPAPEIPKSDLTLAKISMIVVGAILVYKFILKKG